MRTLLLLAVLANSAAITSTAEAQWMRSRRSSECANGQCGSNATGQVARQDPGEVEQAAVPQTQEVEQATATEPADVAAPTNPAPATDPAAAPSDTAATVDATNGTRPSSVSSSRTRTANDTANGRSLRRMRSRNRA